MIKRGPPEWDTEADQKNIVESVRSSSIFDDNFNPSLALFLVENNLKKSPDDISENEDFQCHKVSINR